MVSQAEFILHVLEVEKNLIENIIQSSVISKSLKK